MNVLLIIMLISIVANVVLVLFLKGSNKAKITAEYQNKETVRQLDALLDHDVQDQELVRRQQVAKKKIIEADNEKKSDAVIKHFRDMFNGNEL